MPARARKYIRGAHLFLRGRTFYSRVPGASPVEASLRTDSRNEAERLHAARVLDADARQGERAERTPRAQTRGDLADVAEQFLNADHDWTPRTATSARLRVLAFLRWCAQQEPVIELASQLSHEVIDRWMASRRESVTRSKQPLSQTTLARDWKMVRRWLRWCNERGLCGETPFLSRRPPREPQRAEAPEIPSPREVARVVRALRASRLDGAALAVVVLLATGFRRGELRDLPLENITAHAIKSPPGKGKRERVLPVSRQVSDAARRFVTLREKARGRGARIANELGVGLDDHWATRVLGPACDAAGVPRFGAHDLRRTFATECVRSGIAVLQVQQWLAHRSVATTQRYLGRYRDDPAPVIPTPAALTLAARRRSR